MISENITLRLARMADADAIEEMQVDALYALNSKDYNEAQIEGYITFLGVFDPQLIRDGNYYVAELDGEIIGAGGWERYSPKLRGLCRGLESRQRRCASGSDAIDIRAVFVHPNWTRRGVARVIMAVVEGKALEAGFRRAEAIATVTGAPLYRALGYSERARPCLELPNGLWLPAVYLEKTLDLAA